MALVRNSCFARDWLSCLEDSLTFLIRSSLAPQNRPLSNSCPLLIDNCQITFCYDIYGSYNSKHQDIVFWNVILCSLVGGFQHLGVCPKWKMEAVDSSEIPV
jgi:hypothetical protein